MAALKEPDDFGRKLREARERRGLSLRQIASATKISLLTLEALERNDVARLPGGIFSRAFVRSYALEVGLDPEETIREFMGQYPQDSVTAGHPATGPTEDYEAIESDRRTATTFLRLILVSIPVAAIVVFFGSSERRAALRHVFGVHSSELTQAEPAGASTTSLTPADSAANAA